MAPGERIENIIECSLISYKGAMIRLEPLSSDSFESLRKVESSWIVTLTTGLRQPEFLG